MKIIIANRKIILFATFAIVLFSACFLSVQATAAVQISITYYPNGGTDSNIVDNANSHGYYTIKENTFDNTDYIFDSWNTKADGTGTRYVPKQGIYLTSNLVLYAKWKTAPLVSSTYYPNGGTGAAIVDVVLSDTTYYSIRQNPNYTRSGYTFNGWNTNADGTGKHYSGKQTIYFSNSLILYAKWRENPTITYNPNYSGDGNTIVVNAAPDTYNLIAENSYTRPGDRKSTRLNSSH